MPLLIFIFVAVWEGFRGPLYLMPDLALALSLMTAARERRDRELSTAVAAGLASGLFGSEAWGVKVLICVAVAEITTRWRSGGRPWSARELFPRALAILAIMSGVEVVFIAFNDSLDNVLFVAWSILVRSLTTALLAAILMSFGSRKNMRWQR